MELELLIDCRRNSVLVYWSRRHVVFGLDVVFQM